MRRASINSFQKIWGGIEGELKKEEEEQRSN